MNTVGPTRRQPGIRPHRLSRGLACTALSLTFAVVVPAARMASANPTTAYRPLTPCRLLDTRDGSRAKPDFGESVLLAVRGRCGVAADATAVAVTVTITEAAGPGFITAWPSGQAMPLASTNNYANSETRANAALLSLGADGNLTLFTSQSAHIVVDASGEFYTAGTATFGRFVPTTPARAVDTRDGGAPALPNGGTVTVPLPTGVPADATALAVSLTITAATSAGFVTAYAAGTARPFTSSLNTDGANQTRTTTQIVAVSAGGLTVFSNVGGHLVVDVVGYFTGPSAPPATTGLFIPATPTRIVDTREAVRVFPGGTVNAVTSNVTGAAASAVAANVTVTETGPAGYLTAWAAQTARPPTPAVSYDNPGQTVANLGVVSVSSAGIAVASTSGTHVVVDVTGWFTGPPAPVTTGPPANGGPPRTNPTGPTGCLQNIPAPAADGLYEIQIGELQFVSHFFEAGPKGPIVVIGDSITAWSAPQTARSLRAAGWGPICVDGTVGRTIAFGSPETPDGLEAAARIRASDPIWNDRKVTWIVSLGTNDVGITAGDMDRADLYIADQRAAIGPNPIAWVSVRTDRTEFAAWEATFNQSLANTGDTVIDWHKASAGKGWISADTVHCNAAGYQARADLIAAVQPR